MPRKKNGNNVNTLHFKAQEKKREECSYHARESASQKKRADKINELDVKYSGHIGL